MGAPTIPKILRLTVAAVQMKFRATIPENTEKILATIQTSAAQGVDVILFPECAVTGYNRDFSELLPSEIEASLGRIAATARSAEINVLVGTPTLSGRRRYNSLVVFDRRGRQKFVYSKIHLTPRDARFFKPGNALAYFRIDGVPCTAIICHERRYPELVRLPVMMGAQIVFHPNAGLDTRSVSRTKHGGRDGVVARAFENQVYYVFANSVGPQGDELWSAGDSKIVAPDSRVLALADNQTEAVITAELDLFSAGRKYAIQAQAQPVFLRRHWQALRAACRKQLRSSGRSP